MLSLPGAATKFEMPSWLKLSVRDSVATGAYGAVCHVSKVREPTPEEAAQLRHAPRERYALKKIPDYALTKYVGEEAERTLCARRICRETATILMLQECPYVVPCDLIYLSENKKDVYLLMPFFQYDLSTLIEGVKKERKQDHGFTESEVKSVIHQVLCGVHFMHSFSIMHRDLSANNILLNLFTQQQKTTSTATSAAAAGGGEGGEHKGVTGKMEVIQCALCDFGMARSHTGDQQDSSVTKVCQKCTYMSWEQLLRKDEHDARCDIWSVGIIMAELILGEKFLVNYNPNAEQNENIMHAIKELLEMFGRPSESAFEGGKKGAVGLCKKELDKIAATGANQVKTIGFAGFQVPQEVRFAMLGMSRECIDLLMWMLTFDNKERCGAQSALNHPFFTADPRFAHLPGVNNKPVTATSSPAFPVSAGNATSAFASPTTATATAAHAKISQNESQPQEAINTFSATSAAGSTGGMPSGIGNSSDSLAGGRFTNENVDLQKLNVMKYEELIEWMESKATQFSEGYLETYNF